MNIILILIGVTKNYINGTWKLFNDRIVQNIDSIADHLATLEFNDITGETEVSYVLFYQKQALATTRIRRDSTIVLMNTSPGKYLCVFI